MNGTVTTQDCIGNNNLGCHASEQSQLTADNLGLPLVSVDALENNIIESG